MSAIGTKRTSACALHMSAFDPKRTLARPPPSSRYVEPVRLPGWGFQNEMPRVHQILGWHISSVVADARASPTGGVTGGRLSQWRVDHRGHSGSIPPGPRRNRLCRRPKRSSRVSLGRGRLHRLPGLASELASRNVSVIAAGGGDLAARAAKAATSTIPIVFTSGDDPVSTGLVSSLARPGGNLTGVSFFVVELHAKRFELISELVPQAKVIALIVNPLSPQTERVVQAMQQAAAAKHVELKI